MSERGERYALVTAAYNEEPYIGKLLDSVVAQEVLPVKWVIVSDGSTDGTDKIVDRYASEFAFIQLLRITDKHERNFAAQVNAINRGFTELRAIAYDYIGNLDADISLEPWYFARLLKKFEKDERLGLAGGYIYEERGGAFQCRRTNRTTSVPHGLQLFRRECFEPLGGYLRLPYGGPDWHAEVCVRMNGWRVEAFPDLPAYHHRPTGMAGGLLRYWYRQGFMDFSLGCHPGLEVVRCLRRLRSRPVVVGAFARLLGFLQACCAGRGRPVSDEFVAFLRNEQRLRFRCSLPEPLRRTLGS